MDGDGQTGVTLYAVSMMLPMAGHKKFESHLLQLCLALSRLTQLKYYEHFFVVNPFSLEFLHSFILELRPVLWCKEGCQSKIKKRTAKKCRPWDSFLQSTLFAQASVLVCHAEAVNTSIISIITPLHLTVFIVCILTTRFGQTVQTQIRCCRMQHLIRVFTVCPSSSNIWTQHRMVNCTCSNFR